MKKVRTRKVQGEFITNNIQETQEFAQNFAKKLQSGDIVALYGNLGSGKTTFIQGLGKGLGIKHKIISPTFIIVRQYVIKNNKLRIKDFYHIDLYRIEAEKDIEGLGLLDLFNDKNVIVVIEWAEKIQNLLPEKRWEIHFEYLEEEKRKIKIWKTKR